LLSCSPPASPPPTARLLLSRAGWLKAVADVELHVQHDLEQEDKVRDLTRQVQDLLQSCWAMTPP
jgi:hypothetical protein